MCSDTAKVVRVIKVKEKNKMQPTKEQTVAMSTVVASRVTIVNAYAGAGKTTFLELLTRQGPLEKGEGIYLCFNRSIAIEAKGRFPEHVQCTTINSYAIRKMGGKKLGTVQETLKKSDIKTLLGAQADAVGDAAVETVQAFAKSDDPELTTSHVPDSVEQCDTTTVVEAAFELWTQMWKQRKLTIDAVLKKFQLEAAEPFSEFDFVMVDESQDMDDVMLSLLKSYATRSEQREDHKKLVLVGDEHQAIYRFRGAVNAMAKIKGATCDLTQSWRFGASIAALAYTPLTMKKGLAPAPIIGNPTKESIITNALPPYPYAFIARTNRALVAKAVAIPPDLRVNYVGDVKLLDDVLQALKFRHYGEVGFKWAKYDTWEEVLEKTMQHSLRWAVELAEDSPETAVQTMEQLIAQQRKDRRHNDPHVTLTTAHRSKGLEFDNVLLSHEWAAAETAFTERLRRASQPGKLSGEAEADLVDELNLLYVAITRAKSVLNPGPLWALYAEQTPDEKIAAVAA
jgi:hypothetical protein